MTDSWQGLRRIRASTPAETGELSRYLAATDVRGFALPLTVGEVVASLVEFVGRDQLGRTWSIFGELGGIRAMATAGRPKFLVAEVRGILRRPDCSDTRSLERLESLIAAERSRQLRDRRLTIALTSAGPVVVDGNKRAAAIHELALPEIIVPAFLIESAPGRPTLGVP
jgi:hypothetical protein